MVDDDVATLVGSSAALIRRMQDPSGAYRASSGFAPYEGFCWLRDGAFTADAMSMHGDLDSADAFFDWCARAIVALRPRIVRIHNLDSRGLEVDPSLFLPARFTLDGRERRGNWGDYQIDGYGTWMWALNRHCERGDRDPSRWAEAIELCVNYLRATWRRPCYDWWEERADKVHTSTLLSVAAGLKAAGAMLPTVAEDAEVIADAVLEEIFLDHVGDGHLLKWHGTDRVDGSLAAGIGAFPLVACDSPLARGTLTAIERDLCADGGVHRYLGDSYYGGGLWPVLSCLLGEAHLAAGNADRPRELLHWAASTARSGPHGPELPEQVDHHLLTPDALAAWTATTGPSPSPLVWSHAMFMRLAMALDR